VISFLDLECQNVYGLHVTVCDVSSGQDAFQPHLSVHVQHQLALSAGSLDADIVSVSVFSA
jgi:hypothetical protein